MSNGGFSEAGTTGWQGEHTLVGYPSPIPENQFHRSIGLNGEIYQDLATIPGALYLIEFDTRQFDSSSYWRPNALEIFWSWESVAHFDFFRYDLRLFHPRFTVRATAALTRLQFHGFDYSELDNVAVTLAASNSISGILIKPETESKWTEGDTIPLHTLWSLSGETNPPTTVTYYFNGVNALQTVALQEGVAITSWTNVPPGLYYLSAEAGGIRTKASRIEIKTRPRLILETPKNRLVAAPGDIVQVTGRLLNNHGTNAIKWVKVLINSEAISRIPVDNDSVVLPVPFPHDGNFEIVMVGEAEDGTEVTRASSLIHVLPTGKLDLLQTVEGSFVRANPTEVLAQTFVAGSSGRLVAVELEGGANDSEHQDYTVETSILEVDEATRAPGTNLLGSTQLRFSEARIPPKLERLYFSFPSNHVQLVGGKSYAVTCRIVTPHTDQLLLKSSMVDSLPGGQVWRAVGSGWIEVMSPSRGTFGDDLVIRTYLTQDERPNATITSPANLQSFAGGENVPIAIMALPIPTNSPSRQITILADDLPIGKVSEPELQFMWINPPAGPHLLQARSEDGRGGFTYSPLISFLSGFNATGLPRVRVDDTVSPEGNSSLPPLVFRVTLSAPSAVPVTMHYSTRDLTAVAGVDYLPASGTLTFNPGQVHAPVFVRMLGDRRDEDSRRLYLELRNATGAVMERASAIGTILDDEPGALKPWTYEVSVAPGMIDPGVPVAASLVARDPAGTALREVPGGVTLVAGSTSAETSLLQGAFESTSVSFSGNYTTGFRFRPKTDLLVTHLRTSGGSRVTIWASDRTVLGSVEFPPGDGQWTERPLGRNLLLKAGVLYVAGLFAGHGPVPLGYAGLVASDQVEHWGGVQGGGDNFPDALTISQALVDLRFFTWRERPEVLAPLVITDFSAGSGSGSIALLVPDSHLRLMARDLLGQIGVSPPLPMQTSGPGLIPDPDALAERVSINTPRGDSGRPESRRDLSSGRLAGTNLLSVGSPVHWGPSETNRPTGIYRRRTLE